MNISIVGTGTMGRLVRDLAVQNSDIGKVWNVEPALGETLWDTNPDVVIDFSHPNALKMICDFAKSKKGKVPVIFATTGYSKEEEQLIEELSKTVPVLKSSNYSYGINALKRILGLATILLESSSDIEIIEKHHNQKIDSPSGTANLLADTIDPKQKKKRVFGRVGEHKRKDEIGIHSVRGGTIFGEHQVIFAMKDEVIEIKHTAFSKTIFAKGAIEAAIWIKDKNPGYYTIDDVFY